MMSRAGRSAVIWVVVLFAAGLALGIGASPRYIEEIRVGGGYGDAVDGGSDFERDGDVFTDGSISVTGGILGAQDGSLPLSADTSVAVQIDADNDGTESFQILNGAGTEVASINENGDAQIDGELTVSGNAIRSSTGSEPISLSGLNATINGTASVGDNNGIAGEALNLRVINPHYDAAAVVGIHLQTQTGGANWMSKITTGRSGTWGSFLKLYTDLNSDGGGYAEALALDHYQNCVLGGDLTVTGNDIKDSGGTWLSSDGAQNTTFAAGTLTLGGILMDNDDMVFECDADGDGSNKFSFTNGASTEIARITETGSLQVDGSITSDSGGIVLDNNSMSTITAYASLTIAADDDGNGGETIGFDLDGSLVAQLDDNGNLSMDGGVHPDGNSVLGNASTDTTTNVGRMIFRQIDDSDPDTNVAGSTGEVVFNLDDDTFYGCTDGGGSGSATWTALH